MMANVVLSATPRNSVTSATEKVFRVCVLVAENLNKLNKLGVISLKDLKQEEEKPTTSPLSSKTDQRTDEPASSSVDTADE